MNKKKDEIFSAMDVLEKLLSKGKTPLAQDFQRYRLKTDWEKIVGPTIAAKTSPISFAHKILHIWVTSSTWMNQLFYARKEILKKINLEMGAGWAREIRFTLDHRQIKDNLDELGQEQGRTDTEKLEAELRRKEDKNL